MISNSTTLWGWPAKTLHWVGAIVILLLLGHGWWMTHMAARPDRLAHYAGHSALGYDFLVLVVLRLLWRWTHAAPLLPADLKPWERRAAQAGHIALYLLMLVVAVTGWMVASTVRVPITQDIFGFHFPTILSAGDRDAHRLSEDTHRILAYVLAAIVVIHVIGALRHHFVKRNDVLRRMTWGVRQPPVS